jgi:UPF0716 protein FxsA
LKLFHWLLLAFFTVPLVEIYVLLEVGSVIGALPTIGLVVFTAVLGATLIRAQGVSTLMRAHQSLDRGEVPAVELLEGAFLLVAGALLLTPGFVTDTIGFLCLVPRLRRNLIQGFLANRLAAGVVPGEHPAGGPHPHVIEGEFRREDD